MKINYDQSLYSLTKNPATRAAIDAVNIEARKILPYEAMSYWGLCRTLREKILFLERYKKQKNSQ
jgi:hypothetical protein